jgi:hypothetical protein
MLVESVPGRASAKAISVRAGEGGVSPTNGWE